MSRNSLETQVDYHRNVQRTESRDSPVKATGDVFRLLALLLGVVLVVLAAESGDTAILLLAAGTAVMVLIVLAVATLSSKSPDVSFYLIVPTFMSAFQNVYLSPFAAEMDAGAVQIIIVLNWMYSLMLYLVLVLANSRKLDRRVSKVTRMATVVLIALVLYGFALMAGFGNNPTAAIASARNITSPVLFFLIGAYAAAFCDFRRYLRLFLWLGTAALTVGFIEYLTPGFWTTIGLPALWEKKGIDLTVGSQLPRNFYASEQIVEGEFLRRMAGPFADPVNFGTYLFTLTMVAWFLRARFVAVLAMVAVVLTVSKGALVGLLTFLAVWANKFRSRFEFILAAGAVAVAAAYFYVFTQSSSTGSTTAHINGFFAAFTELPSHPIGRGFGGTGVLAGLFADEGSDSGSAILESGIGMVLGQLGVIGAVLYVLFFVTIIRQVARIQDTRVAVLGMSLVLAFILNAAFNEVALSPNSSAPYFIILGLLVGTPANYERPLPATVLASPTSSTIPATAKPSTS